MDNCARTIATPNYKVRQSDLMAKNSLGTITEAEYNELSDLVERGQRLTLRKAHAMKLLMKRGYSITLDNLGRWR